MAVLVVGVLAYLAVYFARGWKEPVMTAQAYEATVSEGASARGVLVRKEQAVASPVQGGYVELSPGEGETVAAGETLAVIYKDASGLDERQSIRELTAEIEQLRYVLSSGADGSDASRLDAAVLDAIVSLRSISAAGDLSSLEDCALNLRTMVFKRDYTYGGGRSSDVEELIRQKQERLSELQSSLSRAATTVRAGVSGVFSGSVDGYETLLDPESVRTLSPDELDALLDQDVQSPADAVGKLITDSTWYLAVVLDEEQGRDLVVGKAYPVTFSHDWYGTAEMTLEHVSDKQDGRAVYLFSARKHLSETALLRTQTVDIAVRQLHGIRVPRQSLRVLSEEKEDKQTGELTTVNRTGVFTVVGTRAEFQAVNVLHTGEDFYLVEPVDPAAAKRLRAGDAVILNSKDIYNGKVVV